MSDTRKPIALVTGGSSGLGLEIGRLLVARGIDICLVARTRDNLVSAARSVKADGADVLSIAADVGDPAGADRVAGYLDSERRTVKWLVNVAGAGVFGPITRLSPKDVDELLRGNLLGVIYMTQRFLAQLTESHGVLCNVMSTAATVGRVNESVYCAAKWGARGFTEAVRVELKGSGIRIIGAYPGGMRTNFWNRSPEHTDPSKFMPPEDVAAQLVPLILDQSGAQVTEVVINRP